MKLIPILCLLSCLGFLQPASAQIKLNKLKKSKNELLKAKKTKPNATSTKVTQGKSSEDKNSSNSYEPADKEYQGPAKNEYRTLQNRLQLAAKYIQKLEAATSDYQRTDAQNSAQRYLDKSEADLVKVAQLDPDLNLKAERKAFQNYTTALAAASDQAESASTAKANDSKRVFKANQFVDSMLDLLKYNKGSRLGEYYTYAELQEIEANPSIKGNTIFIFRRNMDELNGLLESANLNSWFSILRQDVNNYQASKQFEEAEKLLAFLEPTVNFLADASSNFSRLKQDADFLLSSYRKKSQERAAVVSTGAFHLAHLNQILLSPEAIEVGKEKTSQFKTEFREAEPIRAVLYLDRPMKDLTGNYGHVPINLFINDPDMKSGCVLQYDYSWFTYLEELEKGYLLVDIIPNWDDFRPRFKAIGPESFARCFAGLSPGEHEVTIKLGLTSGSGWGKTFETTFTLEVTEAGLAAYAQLQTDLEEARQWTEKHDDNPMSDAATEQGLLKSLESQISGAKATRAIIKDRDWTYVRDRQSADTMGKKVAAEVYYTGTDGQCYGQRVYAYYKALSHNQFEDRVEAQLVNRPYRVDCK